MSKSSWLTSSIGRKFIMALTGLFLITFLCLHLLINAFSMFSKELFNEASHFMATNPLIQVMQYVLAAGFILHIGMAIALSRRNKAARPQNYVFNKPGESAPLSSRSMVYTGLLVLIFLVLHIKDFFVELKFGDMTGRTDYDLLTAVFALPYYTLIYVVAFVFLGLHLNHGFQSSFQSLGARHQKYTPIIKKLGTAFSLLVAIGFSAIALWHFFNA